MINAYEAAIQANVNVLKKYLSAEDKETLATIEEKLNESIAAGETFCYTGLADEKLTSDIENILDRLGYIFARENGSLVLYFSLEENTFISNILDREQIVTDGNFEDFFKYWHDPA